MSDQIVRTRDEYDRHLEHTQKGDLDVTAWIEWFLNALDAAIDHSTDLLSGVLGQGRFWRSVARESLNERQINDTAIRDIQELVDKGILVKNPGGGRSTSYRIPDDQGG